MNVVNHYRKLMKNKKINSLSTQKCSLFYFNMPFFLTQSFLFKKHEEDQIFWHWKYLISSKGSGPT